MYPINLILDNKPCCVIGGGNVACQKVQSLLDATANVTVISPTLSGGLAELARNGHIDWQQKKYETGDLCGFVLLICASDDNTVNELAAQDARKNHILVNVCDQPASCDFTSPAVSRQGDLLLTVSTNGCSPALAGWLRRHLEHEYGPVYGQWLQHLHKLRNEVRVLLPNSRDRQRFWRTALTDDIMELVRQGKLEEAEARLRHAISCFRPES